MAVSPKAGAAPSISSASSSKMARQPSGSEGMRRREDRRLHLLTPIDSRIIPERCPGGGCQHRLTRICSPATGPQGESRSDGRGGGGCGSRRDPDSAISQLGGENLASADIVMEEADGQGAGADGSRSGKGSIQRGETLLWNWSVYGVLDDIRTGLNFRKRRRRTTEKITVILTLPRDLLPSG